MTEPSIESIENILVVGAGTMGAQIGAVCALAGYRATLQDISTGMLEKAQNEVHSRLERNVDKGRMDREAMDAAVSRLSFTEDLQAGARGADFVIEAATERLDVKRDLFGELDSLAPHHTVLATNSSTIESSRLADATERPDRVCNMHFFNPALIMQCVEVVRNPKTSVATVETTVQLARRLGKSPVVLKREVSGFVANRILHAVRDEALALYEGDVASFEDIDTACRTALGHPMGPFELMDLTGIDLAYQISQGRYEESEDPEDRPPKSVAERYERGDLGRKSGRGWYTYDERGEKTSPSGL